MGYTTEQIEGIAAKLRELPPVEKKKQEHSKFEAIKFLIKEITGLQKKGYTLEQISQSLRGEGLDIAPPTLKSYLQRARSASKSRTAKSSSATVSIPKASGKAAETAQASFAPKPDSDDI